MNSSNQQNQTTQQLSQYVTEAISMVLGSIEKPIRISKFVSNFMSFCKTQHELVCGEVLIYDSFRELGLKKALKLDPIVVQQLRIIMEQFALAIYLEKETLLFRSSFEEINISYQLGTITTSVSNTGNLGLTLGVELGGSHQESREANHRVEPSLTRLVKTGDVQVDNFILCSLLLNREYSVFNTLTEFQQFQIRYMSDWLHKKTLFIRRYLRDSDSTKFKRAGQHVLSDYICNLLHSNALIRDKIAVRHFVPYMLELNGLPGVGKSTFVDLLATLLKRMFPFVEDQDFIYSRVNDKFWNGYRQQPIVLYDDPNQNSKMLYNLDNELIAIGGGKFIHPPMAFEKDTLFSSLFVVITTNKLIRETTTADQGAIARRINTMRVEPVDQFGVYEECGIEGKKWIWHDAVEMDAYNLTFDSNSPSYILKQFISKLLSFTRRTQKLNPFAWRVAHFKQERETEDELAIDPFQRFREMAAFPNNRPTIFKEKLAVPISQPVSCDEQSIICDVSQQEIGGTLSELVQLEDTLEVDQGEHRLLVTAETEFIQPQAFAGGCESDVSDEDLFDLRKHPNIPGIKDKESIHMGIGEANLSYFDKKLDVLDAACLGPEHRVDSVDGVVLIKRGKPKYSVIHRFINKVHMEYCSGRLARLESGGSIKFGPYTLEISEHSVCVIVTNNGIQSKFGCDRMNNYELNYTSRKDFNPFKCVAILEKMVSREVMVRFARF